MRAIGRHAQGIALGQHRAADHGSALQHLHGRELAGHGGHGLVQLLNPGHGVDLRHLRGHLRVVHGIHGVLVVELGHQQLEETVLRLVGVGHRVLGIAGGVGRGAVHAACAVDHVCVPGLTGPFAES
ncbi:hypothetical protein SDC9_135118 [bioreactor metagenome]|uniref:Uncharacterized protein n=1 Tax=bioreactor metagenome TaxID=1076179 RepID=A0A645DFH3_9ZZZZ